MVQRRLAAVALSCLLVLAAAQSGRAESTTMAISVNGRAVSAVAPGMRISVTVRPLPMSRRTLCLGLASAIDRAGLPVSLGRIDRDTHGLGRVLAVIPLRLFPAEPAGPFMLFVGICTPVAPDRPFLARTTIQIVPHVDTMPQPAPKAHH